MEKQAVDIVVLPGTNFRQLVMYHVATIQT